MVQGWLRHGAHRPLIYPRHQSLRLVSGHGRAGAPAAPRAQLQPAPALALGHAEPQQFVAVHAAGEP